MTTIGGYSRTRLFNILKKCMQDPSDCAQVTFGDTPPVDLNVTFEMDVNKTLQVYCPEDRSTSVAGAYKIDDGGKLVINEGVVATLPINCIDLPCLDPDDPDCRQETGEVRLNPADGLQTPAGHSTIPPVMSVSIKPEDFAGTGITTETGGDGFKDLAFDLNELPTDSNAPVLADYIAIYDVSESKNKKITITALNTIIEGDGGSGGASTAAPYLVWEADTTGLSNESILAVTSNKGLSVTQASGDPRYSRLAIDISNTTDGSSLTIDKSNDLILLHDDDTGNLCRVPVSKFGVGDVMAGAGDSAQDFDANAHANRLMVSHTDLKTIKYPDTTISTYRQGLDVEGTLTVATNASNPVDYITFETDQPRDNEAAMSFVKGKGFLRAKTTSVMGIQTNGVRMPKAPIGLRFEHTTNSGFSGIIYGMPVQSTAATEGAVAEATITFAASTLGSATTITLIDTYGDEYTVTEGTDWTNTSSNVSTAGDRLATALAAVNSGGSFTASTTATDTNSTPNTATVTVKQKYVGAVGNTTIEASSDYTISGFASGKDISDRALLKGALVISNVASTVAAPVIIQNTANMDRGILLRATSSGASPTIKIEVTSGESNNSIDLETAQGGITLNAKEGITITSQSANPSTAGDKTLDNKLHNTGGNLYWEGKQIATGISTVISDSDSHNENRIAIFGGVSSNNEKVISGSAGFTHDGTDFTVTTTNINLVSNNVIFGTDGDANVVTTYKGDTNDGTITWAEDENYFLYSNDGFMNSDKKLFFRDGSSFVNSTDSNTLNITSNTTGSASGLGDKIHIQATTIDLDAGSVIKTLDVGASSAAFPAHYSAAFKYGGEVLKLLDSPSNADHGYVYYLNGSGTPTWTKTNATNSSAGAKELLAIATTSGAPTEGMLMNGYIRFNSGFYGGTAVVGNPLYLSEEAAGKVTFTVPATSGNIIRIIGYCIVKDSSNDILIYFNPSTEWIERA